MSDPQTVDIRPGVSILGVLSHLNYEPWYALAEYVDNALQSSHASEEELSASDINYRLKVHIQLDLEGDGCIVVEDNAAGIRLQDFPRAFRAAEVPPDRTGLSEFGMGMKSASIWFARRWTVETTSIGDQRGYRILFDIDEVIDDDLSSLDIETFPVDADTHFTKVTLWNLNQHPRGRTLGKIRDHLRDIYRVFLRDGSLELTVGDEVMQYIDPPILRAVDVRLLSDDGDGSNLQPVEWRKDIQVTLASGVRVNGFAAIREEGSTRLAGFALFRRGRVIVGSGEETYRPRLIFSGGNSFRSQRLFGELNVDGLPVSHTKDGFQWGAEEEEFLALLRAELDAEPLPLLNQADDYRSRTVSRRQAQYIQAATENTARVVAQQLPRVIDEVESSQAEKDTKDEASVGPVEDVADSVSAAEVGLNTKVIEFDLEHRHWKISVAANQQVTETRWLSKSITHPSPGQIEISIILHAGHPFVSQFALGDRDSFESVLRLAVALVVAESLTRDAGLKYTNQMVQNFNTVLTKALSTRH